MRSKEVLKKDIARLKNDLSKISVNDYLLIPTIEELQECYAQILLLDLDQALDEKIELDLWNQCFKVPISRLQGQFASRKDPKYREYKSRYQHVLEFAMGFYLTLLQSFKEEHGLALPDKEREATSVQPLKRRQTPSSGSPPSKSSLLYLAQHVYIHLGDLARYRRQTEIAERYYKQAVAVEPSNGHAYNQLALLEAADGNQLSVVFYYVRSVSVKHPFPPGAANLEKVYSKLMETELKLGNKSRINTTDYLTCFLTSIAHLYSTIGLGKVSPLGRLLCSSLSALVAVEAFSAWKLVQMSAILLHTLHHTIHQLTLTAGDSLVSVDEQRSYEQGLDLLAMSLNGYLLAAYTLSVGQVLLDYAALPSVKIILWWIKLNPSVLTERAFSSRMQLWPSLAKLLNSLQSSGTETITNQVEDFPLPEDCDLREFVPLQKYFRTLDFKTPATLTSGQSASLRVRRLIDLGRWLTTLDTPKLLTAKEEDGAWVFEAVTQQSGEVTRQLQELSLAKEEILTKGNTPSNSDLSQTSSQASEDVRNNNEFLKRALVLDEAKKGILKIPNGIAEEERKFEKRPSFEGLKLEDKKGILKFPPGEILEDKPKKSKNVAINAILRKNAEEKQKEEEGTKTAESKMSKVTFRTPSPSITPTPAPIPQPSQQFRNVYLERLMLEQQKRNQETPQQEEYVLFGPRNPIITPISQISSGWTPPSFSPSFPPPIYPPFAATRPELGLRMMNGNMETGTQLSNWESRAGIPQFNPITPPMWPDFRHPPPRFFAKSEEISTNGNHNQQPDENGSYQLFNTSWPTLTSTVPPPNATGGLTEGKFGFPGMERSHAPQQTLWSANGPSPLERLLEFQRGQSKT